MIIQKNKVGVVKNVINDKRMDTKIYPIRKENGELTEDFNEGRDTIIKRHFPKIPKSMEKDGAPGPDGWALEEIFLANKDWFLIIMYFCLQKGYFLRPLKIAEIVLIPKEGKDTTNFKSYSPICLLCTWVKILDKIMTTRLKSFLEDSPILSENQHGFRKNHDTIRAHKKVMKFISNAKSGNKIMCIVSLDIENAFNSIKWSQIKQLLIKYKIPKLLGSLIKSFLSNRYVKISIGIQWEDNIVSR
ncbi:hypothetical protein AVEN_257856-1 [Araneus ventricosus]|uniref:Reverse transcriptase domain-containing protein n=1 Tax=Araneus ventricosus TaxID=182803 RepID=A0A4Y2EI68_ARAVE|nr:hypothetical protein AVEN_257856-1 [Araneus ventricosus]